MRAAISAVRVAAGFGVALSLLLGWFVDPDMQTFGPRGYTHCHDIQCSAIDIELPILARAIGAAVLLLGLATAIVALANRGHRSIPIATTVAGIAFALVSIANGGAMTREFAGGSRIAIGLPIFLAATLVIAISRVRSTRATPV